jgi:hypothetical protein
LPSTPRHQPRLPSPASCTSPLSHSWMPSTLIAVDAPTSGEPNLGKQQMSLSLTLIPVVDSVAQDVVVTRLRSDWRWPSCSSSAQHKHGPAEFGGRQRLGDNSLGLGS